MKIHNSYKNKELELEWSAKYVLKIVCTRSAAVCFPRPLANDNLPSIELNANLVTDDKQWDEIISNFLKKFIRFHIVQPNVTLPVLLGSTKFWAQFLGSNRLGWRQGSKNRSNLVSLTSKRVQIWVQPYNVLNRPDLNPTRPTFSLGWALRVQNRVDSGWSSRSNSGQIRVRLVWFIWSH